MWKPRLSRNRRPPASSVSPAGHAMRRMPIAERLEPRMLMAADPIRIGVVYVETDYLEPGGGTSLDANPDLFLLTFNGGAPGTELTQLRIQTDKDGDGLSVGDLIFDTLVGGRGKGGAHPFKVEQIKATTGEKVTVNAEVEDGSTELIVRLVGFRAGDQLVFSIDVDEILRLSDDLDFFNSRLDVIASGQEFQDSLLQASFEAPHFEVASVEALFINEYGDPKAMYGLDLPAHEGPGVYSRPSRNAAAVGTTTQVPKPISISGTVWVDDNLNLRRDPGELVLPGVEVALFKKDPATGQFRDTGLKQVTDSAGKYSFGTQLGLKPGEYQVVQSQPVGYFSVGAVAGQIAGNSVGRAASSDILTGILLPLGDLHAVNYDFAEARPARVSGFVYRDDNDNAVRDSGEQGIGGVTIRLVPIDSLTPINPLETVTRADGSYEFTSLPPGQYDIIQVTQPVGLTDGRDSPGTVDGVVVGVADEPGDAIRGVALVGHSRGVDYNFGELPLGSISGGVFLAPPGEDCTTHDDPRAIPLGGVVIELLGPGGVFIARTTTGLDGQYQFDDVPKGIYSVIEVTPEGLLDGRSRVGRIDGVSVGTSVDGGRISDIVLPAGKSAIRYDFCEAAPGTIAGHVYHDRSNDGRRDPGEEPIADVVIELVNPAGTVVATTRTLSDGQYRFEGVLPGIYAIRQTQPHGFLDGLDSAGTVDGVPTGIAQNPGDLITGVNIRQGQRAIEYNFGELKPASLSGRVHVDLNGNCTHDPGEPLLAGVVIRLLDASGRQVAITQTNGEGRYHFDSIPPGNYTLVEEQPDGYFEGSASPGTAGGTAENPSRIGDIRLTSGQVAVDYDFCEKPPAEIAGIVFVDRNANAIRDLGEPTLSGVRIDLIDSTGRIVATTTTDPDGQYRFANLPAGTYTLRETQPIGYLQGGQTAGTGGGDDSFPDVISSIPISFGDRLTQYNFFELEAGSISGQVWSETDLNRRRDPDDRPIEGVTIELLDATGRLLTTTQTDSAGRYRLGDLPPGVYTVRQQQPAGLFHGGQIAGSAGGNTVIDDVISEITLPAGIDAVDYDFPEFPPSILSGFVFQDGEPISLRDDFDPARLREFRDGIMKPDDLPIAGVTLELRNPVGQPFTSDLALAGTYPAGAIRVVTDEAGYFEFPGLPPGTYHVYQVQPDGFIDGLDTPGTTGGVAINVPDEIDDPQTLELLRTLLASPSTDPSTDAILNIALPAGVHSNFNNFSEVLVIRITAEVPAPPIFPAPLVNDSPLVPPPEPADRFPKVFGSGEIARLRPPMIADAEYAVTWHLSVINGGYPRGASGIGPRARVVSNADAAIRFQEGDHRRGRWLLVDLDGKPMDVGQTIELGDEDAVPLVGDFNGDGVDQVAIYVNGQWFVDLNGNGVWDTGDLWIRLGTKLDRPVVGDWDGDGKADVAIFGPQWEKDPEAIIQDPGLPNSSNTRRRNFAQTASVRAGESFQSRYLIRGDDRSLRADAIDHVFRYGEQPDRPLSGDWNGDGIDAIAVFRAGVWMLDVDGDGRWTDRDLKVEFGRAGDIPIVGDWNGDGIDNLGVVRGDVFILDVDGDGRITGNDLQIAVKKPSEGAIPIVGDWDGDGKDELGWFDNAR